jgi:multidrug efflux pump subunit AcrB
VATPVVALAPLVVAIVLLVAAAFGVTHQRVQLVPLALAIALLAPIAWLWPP